MKEPKSIAQSKLKALVPTMQNEQQRSIGATKLTGLEKELFAKILMQMAAVFDTIQPPITDSKKVRELMSSAALTAEGIASKLMKSISEMSGDLNPEVWQELVENASRDAFMAVDDMLLPIGTIPNFRDIVATATEICVAPPGSPWARAIEARDDDQHRRELAASGASPQDTMNADNSPTFLEEQLVEHIMTFMAIYLDAKHGNFGEEVAGALAQQCRDTAIIVTLKLILGIKAMNRNLDSQRWREMVDAATRDATLFARGNRFPIGADPNFREGITTVTETCVAPPGSSWALAAENAQTEKGRALHKSLGTPVREAEAHMESLRKERESIRRRTALDLDRLRSRGAVQ